ncbi:hypothetical protein O1611_g9481 [Lasiodiplodia mahajangana]|uniref:Uncharacterized protein n=1 Tax=Lasiodiplodia mahajangana TaxID=1108764 RepID=A0ACC2J8T8_9PEZI|nr:hypothetical protein O1611_g9481 [Lasiodiplodia mahajangana]
MGDFVCIATLAKVGTKITSPASKNRPETVAASEVDRELARKGGSEVHHSPVHASTGPGAAPISEDEAIIALWAKATGPELLHSTEDIVLSPIIITAVLQSSRVMWEGVVEKRKEMKGEALRRKAAGKTGEEEPPASIVDCKVPGARNHKVAHKGNRRGRSWLLVICLRCGHVSWYWEEREEGGDGDGDGDEGEDEGESEGDDKEDKDEDEDEYKDDNVDVLSSGG